MLFVGCLARPPCLFLQYWGLTTFTTYLFTGVRDNVTADSASCQRAAVGLARRVIEGCDSGGAWVIKTKTLAACSLTAWACTHC